MAHGRLWQCLVAGLSATAFLAATHGAPPPPDGYRPVPPGGLTVIPADRSADDTVQRSDLPEITVGRADLRWTPRRSAANTTLVERAKGREFAGDVWCLEFAFKPPRMIDVDIPAADGLMRRERIWYLLYRVRNTGGRRTVVEPEDPTRRSTETFDRPIRFIPHFVLESLEPLADAEGSMAYRAYLDRLVPEAMPMIATREKLAGRLHDSSTMTESDIPPGEERWGVAVWEDVDPRIDFFSIYVRGLTNAVRWRPVPGATSNAGDPPGSQAEHAVEALRLDFWRAGDERDENETEIGIGHAGMFERTALGGRLVEAAGRGPVLGSRPTAGLEALKLGWTDLLEPDAGGGMPSLLPLETVLRRLAALPDPTSRAAAVKDLWGDMGVTALEELARALAAPVDADRDAARRAALQPLGLTPETVVERPLGSLALVVRALESAPTYAERQRQAAAFFGADGKRVDRLGKDLAIARTVTVLEDLGADCREIARGDTRTAFATLQKLVEPEADKQRRSQVLQGLFGPRGPELYAAAAGVHEGVDHAWVFRYEHDPSGPG